MSTSIALADAALLTYRPPTLGRDKLNQVFDGCQGARH